MTLNLMDIQGQVTPEDSRRHLRIPFVLPSMVEQLNLRFEYGPKMLTDKRRAIQMLKQSFNRYLLPDTQEIITPQVETFLPLSNLMTLSLDDPHRYRGACHRHDPVQELYVSAHGASNGLLKGDLEQGPWCVTISIHCIVTDICHYRLKIWTDREEETL